MKAQILSMLQLQDTMNQKVHPSWRTQGFKWTRAIMVEGVEALEHYGWKWWKKQEPDLPQLRIELVDIWHFIMSDAIESNPNCSMEENAEQFARRFAIGAPGYLVDSDPRKNLELLIGAAAYEEVNFKAFLALMEQVGLSFEDLNRIYTGKNVLNMFRQNHGYKEGTYVKIWDGLEDNVVLDSIMQALPSATPGEILSALERSYAQVTA